MGFLFPNRQFFLSAWTPYGPYLLKKLNITILYSYSNIANIYKNTYKYIAKNSN